MTRPLRNRLVKVFVAGPVIVAQVAGPVAVATVAASWTSQVALAACGNAGVSGNGFGPPSISVAEASTTEVLEQIRRRQERAVSEPTPVAFADEPAEEPAPAEPPAAEEAPAAEAPPAEEEAPAAEAPAEEVAMAPTMRRDKGFYEPKSFREPVAEYGDKNRGAWVRGYLDWNRHSNLAPGQEENPTRRQISGGGMAGMDKTYRRSARELIQVGAFAGYTGTNSDFSTTVFTDIALGDTYRRTDAEQDIWGPFVGAYLAYAKNQWLTDLAFKVDILELSQKSKLTQLNCDPGEGAIGTTDGSSSLTSYVIAGNTQYRMPHGENRWWAPTFGWRYTNTDFGSDRDTTFFTVNPPPTQPNPSFGRLGLDDGQALRLQGGLRFGHVHFSGQNTVWTTELAALIYSDVWVEGFTFTSTSGGTVTPVDEGKVRALGQIWSTIYMGNGTSYLFQGEVYGGEDLIGVAGQIGMRYEW